VRACYAGGGDGGVAGSRGRVGGLYEDSEWRAFSEFRMNGGKGLFVIVVPTAGYDKDPAFFHVVNKTIFFIDAPAVFTMKISR